MNQSIVAVIDGTRARFFKLESAKLPEYQSGPNLVESQCLCNQANELQGKELWANTKTGRNRGSNGQAHGYDDRRESHAIEFERSFAKDIVSEIVRLSQVSQAVEVILVAEPQILGLLREVLSPLLVKNIKVIELAKDLCKLTPQQIHEYLAKKNILPARKVFLT
ncbi:MAG: host attachment protein [Prochloraceae cyanobacterium]|nr:host attachment protein [Prochloraceae cyanobacterium]